MLKISFGSFPLTEILDSDRRCLDRYLIKNFSDIISLSDAMRNLSKIRNLTYITPDMLMKNNIAAILGSSSNRSSSSKTDEFRKNDNYERAMKRAFYILKEFYSNLKNIPLYRDYVYYPIYIEQFSMKEKTDGSTVSFESDIKYDFLIISNDLTRDLKLSEIKFDETAAINFLYLYILFYSPYNSKKVGMQPSKSTTFFDFNERDLEFLMKLYRYIEKLKITPVRLINKLYRFVGFLNRLSTISAKNQEHELTSFLNDYFKDMSVADLREFKKYENFMRDAARQYLKNIHSADLRQETIKLLDKIFNNENILSYFGEISWDNNSVDVRKEYIYGVERYSELLSFGEALVQYNKYNCNDIFKKDHLNDSLEIEIDNTKVDIKRDVVCSKYEIFFSDFLQIFIKRIKLFLISHIRKSVAPAEEIKKLKITLPDYSIVIRDVQQGIDLLDNLFFRNRNSFIYNPNTETGHNYDVETNLERIDASLSLVGAYYKGGIRNSAAETVEQAFTRVRGVLIFIEEKLNVLMGYHNQIVTILRNSNSQSQENNPLLIRRLEVILDRAINSLQNLYDQLLQYIAFLRRIMDSGDSVAEMPAEILEKMASLIASSLSTDLTFLFDDGRRLCSTNSIAEQMLKETKNGNSLFDICNSGVESESEELWYVMKDICNDIDSITDSFAKSLNEYIIDALLEMFSDVSGSVDVKSNVFRDLSGAFEIENFRTAGQTTQRRNNVFRSNEDMAGKLSFTDSENSIISEAVKRDILQQIIKKYRKNDVITKSEIDEIKENTLKIPFEDRVIRQMLKFFDRKISSTKLQPNEDLAMLHPIFNKIRTTDGKCNYFKSFVIKFETVLQLYNLVYITELKQFEEGIIRKPPKKLNAPLNRVKTVIYEMLRLDKNPLWLISNNKIYLSMPDSFSLTGVSVLSDINKQEMKELCNIRFSDYWQSNKMGSVTRFDSAALKKLRNERDRLERLLKDLFDRREDADRNELRKIDNQIKTTQKQLANIEHKIEKEKERSKFTGINSTFITTSADTNTQDDQKNSVLSSSDRVISDILGDQEENEIDYKKQLYDYQDKLKNRVNRDFEKLPEYIRDLKKEKSIGQFETTAENNKSIEEELEELRRKIEELRRRKG